MLATDQQKRPSISHFSRIPIPPPISTTISNENIVHSATTVVTRSSRHHMPTRASWVHSGKGRELCSSPILTCSWQATLGGTFYPPHTLFYQSSPVHRALLRPMHAAAVVAARAAVMAQCAKKHRPTPFTHLQRTEAP